MGLVVGESSKPSLLEPSKKPLKAPEKNTILDKK